MFFLSILYALMINPTVLTNKLAGIVGFVQPFNPKYAILDSANQLSTSGYYVNDNPFVKIESLKDCQDYSDITDSDFNDFLRKKVTASILKVANSVFNQPDYIDRQLIFKNAINKFSETPTSTVSPSGNYVNTYDLLPGFTSYWLKPSSKKNIAFEIKRVLVEFNGTGDVTLYLYNTSDLTVPLKSKTITVTGPFHDIDLGWVCDNAGSAGYKGDYYLGYFSAGMSIKPFKREYRDGMVMSTISELFYEKANFADFTQPSDAFDLVKRTAFPYYNGINPEILVYEDFTDMIVHNAKLFARAIQLDCQISLLTESVASLRSNRNERMSAQYAAQVMAQIEGETGENNVKVKGLRPQFYGAIASIKKEFDKLKMGYTAVNQIRIETIS